jgi:hypothetical protein
MSLWVQELPGAEVSSSQDEVSFGSNSKQYSTSPQGTPLARLGSVICPAEHFVDPGVVQRFQKNSVSPLTQIKTHNFRRPAPHEGRFAIVTDVGGGMRWTRQRQARRSKRCAKTNDVAADGEVVRAWRPDAGAGSRGIAKRRWQESRSPGSPLLHLRVQRASGFPCAL